MKVFHASIESRSPTCQAAVLALCITPMLASVVGAASSSLQGPLPTQGPTYYQPNPCTLAHIVEAPYQSAHLEFVFQETAWRVVVRNTGLKGLWISSAEFKRPQDTDYNVILKESGPADIFVPYHEGPSNDINNPPRPYDLRFTRQPFGTLVELGPADLPSSGGELVTLSGDVAPRVITEIRDRGLAWVCKGSILGQGSTRRGKEALVWAIQDAGNYDNIIQYGFRDDGTITFRYGVSGYNNQTEPLVAHMHNCLWRADVDLFSATGNIVSVLEHVEPLSPPVLAQDTQTPVTQEGAIDWNPLKFTSLLIENATVFDNYGARIGYELSPWGRTGTSRHYGTDANDGDTTNWTHHDFYVSEYRDSELGWMSSWQPPDTYLLGNNGIGNLETLDASSDPVLWVITSAHHDPHDEDHAPTDPPTQVNGITLVHWSGFDLVPHNLMSWNPLGAPTVCDPQYCPLPSPCGAFYRYDESGGTIIDSSGANNSGSATGTTHVSGLVSTALRFNGTSDYVSVPDSASLNFGTGSFTIEGWVRPTAAVSSTEVLLEKRSQVGANVNGYSLFLYSTGVLGFQLGTGAYSNYLAAGAGSIPALNAWTHVAAVVDRAGPCPTITLYVNGLIKCEKPLNLLATASVTNTSALWMGRNLLTGAGYFHGDLDEFALYPRALTWKEILSIVNVGSGGKI